LTRGKRSQASPERTEEERERDRAEREKRRAERTVGQGAGAAADAPPHPNAPSDESPIDVPPPEPATAGWELAQPSPADGAPRQPDAEDEAHVHAEPHDPERRQGAEPPTMRTPPAPDEPPGPPSGTGAPPIAPSGPFEPITPPSPAAPVSPEQETASTTSTGEFPASGSRMPPAPPASPSASRRPASRAPAASARRRPGGRPPLPRALALVALAAVVAAVVLLVKSLAGSGSERKTPVPAVARVVIPEGSTRLQIARIAARDGLKGSYRGASKRSPLLDPTHYGAPAGTRDLEGFLFPATYDMFPGAPVSRLVQEQLTAFRENFSSSELAGAHALHVTPYQLLTIASMVEREAKVPGDRPKIAAVIYNRLKKGMPLGIDATIYYALEMQKGLATYTKELTEAQLQLNSPYNTRTHTGLPPTPISNPGLASIEAATKPAHVAYLYYVLAADGCGEHTFSTTLAKFEADAAAYQAAVKKNGGAPPSCKK
jgi:cell division protein YceG involved in septum cleavage